MRCGNFLNCSGKMVIKCKHTKDRVWVEAHGLPVFAQCDECGHAPLVKHQPRIIQKILVEYTEFDGYIRGMDSTNSVTTRKRRKTTPTAKIRSKTSKSVAYNFKMTTAQKAKAAKHLRKMLEEE